MTTNKNAAFATLVAGLHKGSKQHWNQTVMTLTFQVMKSYMEMDAELFEQCSTKAKQKEEESVRRGREKDFKWQELERRTQRM